MATIEIDGKSIEVENGKTIIEVADEQGIYIPRFCYHKKLSVAANCRMCLVEVENSKKTVPACATPINDGMKVFTKSSAAIRSQEAVMEFLLINHPLDCPICDQGGECELQDISMGFGRDASIYEETKRAVDDDDLGTLIATDMTRCIQCTRCVRFGKEVAGLPELGRLGRGENMQISTYVEHSMVSEISGNIIDLCPVGALTSKPYRYTARPWELAQYEGVAPHDCLGSNVYFHVRRNQLMRVVPKQNEAINETWLSDRDRFSYLGLQHQARAAQPMIKRDGQWHVVDWETALTFTVQGMKRIINQYGPEQIAAFASSSSTLEELYLLQKLMRELGVKNLDHRLQQVDFQDQALQPIIPTNTLSYTELENQTQILIVGCNIKREVPLASTRVRKAELNGGRIYSINCVDYPERFKVAQKVITSPQELPLQLATLLTAVVKDKTNLPEEVQKLTLGLAPDKNIQMIAEALHQEKAAIVTGAVCENHPHAALLRTLTLLIAQYSGAKLLRFTSGSNYAGACLAGMLPHRGVGGTAIESPGMDVQAAIDAKLKSYLLMGVEPEFDFANPYGARRSMLAAEFVVVMSAFQSDFIQEYANVILPIAPYAETSGTYINIDQSWQSMRGIITPFGEARPAWKILRVLGNIFECHGFDYTSSEEVLQEIKAHFDKDSRPISTIFFPEALPIDQAPLVRIGEWPLYRSDAIVRHAEALQSCAAAEPGVIRMHPKTIERLNLNEAATIVHGDIEITLPLLPDERIASDAVWIPNAMPETIDLGHAFAAVTIK